MIKGLAITPPVVGRITIGRVVEKNGKRIPEKDDQFSITTQIQQADGNWIPHRFDEILRQATAKGKIRTIPVRLLFRDPDLNLRAEYSMFDRKTGRPICTGNGELCRRSTASGMQTLPCPSPDGCDIGKGGLCKPFGRLNVVIDGSEHDEFGTFIFRTTGYNSIRVLAARLAYYQAVSGNLLPGLPLELRIRGKSTTQSYRTPIYYVDLTIREGFTLGKAILAAKEDDEQRSASGYNQAALDASARLGFSNGAFEESEEEIPELVAEFYPEAGASANSVTNGVSTLKPTLKDKLDKKAIGMTEVAA